jgi:predicted CopG family antitoxin
MRKKLTLTIDADVYAMIKELPRKVSISEVVSWMLKSMYEVLKKGRELTQEEFDEWIKNTPEGRAFKERFKEHWGPTVYKIEDTVNGLKEKLKPKGKKK